MSGTHLQVTLVIKEYILRFEVAVGNALRMEVGNSLQDLFEATLDFARRHTPFLDCGVEVATGTEFHDLTPVLVLILNEIYGLNDVDMMEGGRYTKFGGKFLHVFLFRLVLPSLSEFLPIMIRLLLRIAVNQNINNLDSVKLFFTSIPFMCEAHDRCSTLSDGNAFASAIFLQ